MAMRKSFAHINGVDYELLAPRDTDQAASLAAELRDGVVRSLGVLLGGRPVDIWINHENVWACSVWSVKDAEPQIF